MNTRSFFMISTALFAATLAFAQTATLIADKLAAATGTEITLNATANYGGAPGAVAWSVVLPEGWSLVSTAGPNAPQVAPQAGTTGTLEWAYTEVPANGARFSFKVKTGGQPGVVRVAATVLIRADGKLQTVEVPAVNVSVVASAGS